MCGGLGCQPMAPLRDVRPSQRKGVTGSMSLLPEDQKARAVPAYLPTMSLCLSTAQSNTTNQLPGAKQTFPPFKMSFSSIFCCRNRKVADTGLDSGTRHSERTRAFQVTQDCGHSHEGPKVRYVFTSAKRESACTL